ncbi:MAG TPA: tyrosine-type recombinase/integrase [Syntrophorhabdales bacterium]|nr:tyrosine-type recombinase/integrase [Syntrophorhabdales bacterium]
MLAHVLESYLSVRRACGFDLRSPGSLLRSFVAFSNAKGKEHVCSQTATEWAGLARSVHQRARRLGHVIRFARYARAEDQSHELPPPVFGSSQQSRPIPYIFPAHDIVRLIQTAAQSSHPFRRQTYRTFFALLSCTGLRVSEAIRLRLDDITTDGMVIRRTKFRKSRLVPLHPTARAELERYLDYRLPYGPFDNHVFVSLRGTPLRIDDVQKIFKAAVGRLGLRLRQLHPTLHSLRHTFAVRALEASPDGRERIARHMVALSTYLGHSKVLYTYWYLEATPELMEGIAARCESFVTGGQP